MDEIVLVHRKKAAGRGPLRAHPVFSSEPHWLHVETCLRELSFGLRSQFNPDHLENDMDLFAGACAYRFCLEMACGLYSPILGETEVFGQFRSFFAPEKISHLRWHQLAESFSQQIFSDVKALRKNYLIGIGSQSYGSFARRFVAQDSPALVIGGGQLAQEILPWLGKQKREQLDVLVRRTQQVQEIEEFYPYTKAYTWATFNAQLHTLVVAAPVSGRDLEKWISERELQVHSILDLREESAYDDLSHLCQRYCALHEVFEEMQKTKASLGPVIIALRADIEKRVQSQMSRASYRPFGWDDLCA